MVAPVPIKINAKKLDLKPGFAPAASTKKADPVPEPAPVVVVPSKPAPPREEVIEESVDTTRFAPLRASKKEQAEHPMVRCLLVLQ